MLYQGLFSVGARVAIADVSLNTRTPGGDTGYRETEMGITSEAYGPVEAFYPIRYRFRSWYLEDGSTCLASEYYERNNRSGGKHRLVYLDDPEQPFVTHELSSEDQLDLPALREGRYPTLQMLPSQVGRFDRLGLLQRVRGHQLSPGDVLEAQVSNGQVMLTYRVTVEAGEPVEAAGRSWNALKLRFDGFKPDSRGKPRAAHRPVFIWLSDDERHIPLLAVSRHALGRFSIELQPAPGLTQLVKLDQG